MFFLFFFFASYFHETSKETPDVSSESQYFAFEFATSTVPSPGEFPVILTIVNVFVNFSFYGITIIVARVKLYFHFVPMTIIGKRHQALSPRENSVTMPSQ